MTYEDLICEANSGNIEVYEINFPKGIKGLYCDGYISINKKIETTKEKKCILAEELDHYHTSVGNIIQLQEIYTYT